MNRQAVRPTDLGDRRNLVHLVDRSRLAGLGDADRRGLRVMHVAAPANGRGQIRGTEPGVVAPQGNQFGAAGKQLRRAAFVGIDVGEFVAVDRSEGRRHGGQGQRVGCRACHHREDRHIGFKYLRERAFQACGPGICAIGRGGSGVCCDNGVHHLRTDARCIV